MSYNYSAMKKTTQNNFTQNSHTMQLKMKFDVATYVSKDSKVHLVCKIIEEMNLSSLLSTYSKKGRKPSVDPANLLKIILFCYSEGITSSRKIEAFCKYDTRAFYILDGASAPDHTTINRFRKNIEAISEDLLNQFVKLLMEIGHIDMKTLYIDGTKIESVAGRYTFVWRKSVEKYQKKLMDKAITELGLPESSNLDQVRKGVQHEFNHVKNICEKEKIVFVHGSGKRKSKHQKDYEKLKDVLDKFKGYEAHLKMMGNRNSYSKTDPEATFMRMKEDHMKNGQLKPAYNLQLASNGAFVVGVMGSQKSNDLHTLKPLLNQMMPHYREYLENIVADAGYESAENYSYLKINHLNAYIKPANYEVKKSKKYRNDIGKKENMTYIENEDFYLCQNNKKLVRGKDSVKKYESGFKDTVRTYTCYECISCPFNSDCIKSRKDGNRPSKTIKFSPHFELCRQQSEENLKTNEGINHRINRSIQAEGVFSKLKDGLGYKRFRHRSMKSIVADVTLMALGINLNKLHSKMLNNQKKIIAYKKMA